MTIYKKPNLNVVTPNLNTQLHNTMGVVTPNLNTQFINPEQQAWNTMGVVTPNTNTQLHNTINTTPEQQAWDPTGKVTPKYDFQGVLNNLYNTNPQNIWSKIFGNTQMDGGFMGEFQNFLNNYKIKRWGK